MNNHHNIFTILIILLFAFSCSMTNSRFSEDNINAENSLFSNITDGEVQFVSMAQNQVEYDNIALGLPTKASGEYSRDYPSKYLVNGNPEFAWASPLEGSTHWAYIDLESTTEIHGLEITWYDKYFARGYEIFISDNTTDWNRVYSDYNGTGGTKTLYGTGSCRFIGLLLVNKNDAAYAISEIKVLQEKTGPSWNLIGNAGFTPNLHMFEMNAISNGVPYVAFIESSVYRLSVMKFENNTWQYVGDRGFRKAAATAQHGFFVDGNVPYVAFNEYDTGNICVMAYKNEKWEYVGKPDFFKDYGMSIDLKVHDNVPYLVYSNSAIDGTAHALKFNGNDWEYMGTPGFSNGFARFTKLGFLNDTPYLAFGNSSNDSKPSVMKFSNNSWSYVGNEIIGDKSINTIFIDFNFDKPYVVFDQDGNAVIKEFDGVKWNTIMNTNIPKWFSFRLHDNIPYFTYVSYKEDYKIRVVKYNGQKFETIGSSAFSPGYVMFPELLFDGDTPYVFFGDQFTYLRLTVMKYD